MRFIVEQFGSIAITVIAGVLCLGIFFVCFQNIATMFVQLVSVIV